MSRVHHKTNPWYHLPIELLPRLGFGQTSRRALLDYHHGMGDHLIMNGLVREYAKIYNSVELFCVAPYLPAVSFMFRDLENLRIRLAGIPAPKGRPLVRFFNRLRGYTIKGLYANEETGIQCERQYYAIAGVPFEKKWSSFQLERDRVREEALFQKLAPAEPYIFVHDDNRYPIDEERLSQRGVLGGASLKGRPWEIVRPLPGFTDNMFDYCLLLERAAEIHATPSSFMYLADLLPYQNPSQKLFLHQYARELPPTRLPLLKKDWKILT